MRYPGLASLTLVCLSAVTPAAFGAELHFESLSAGQLSETVAGQSFVPVLVHVPLSAGLNNIRPSWGISTINDIGTAGSMGQAATSIAVHAALRMQPRGF